MNIFLSFASSDRPAAEAIQLALLGAGHQVFFDEASLPAGSDYNSRIREAIDQSEAFIFLISPKSAAHGRYAQTELKFAKAKWPKPWGAVLPVMIAPTDYELIDPYLAAVTILEPRGSAAAEIAAAVAGLRARSDTAGSISQTERAIVDRLLTYLESKRLITEEAGYQSHFPDNLRLSAEQIRARTNEALQQVGRRSLLTPVLKRIQNAAREFQQTTEGAADGSRMHGGMTPHLPSGLSPYLRSLEAYRQEIAEGMMEAAHLCGSELDPETLVAFRNGQAALREIADSFDRESQRLLRNTH